jgi:hypothetical protein
VRAQQFTDGSPGTHGIAAEHPENTTARQSASVALILFVALMLRTSVKGCHGGWPCLQRLHSRDTAPVPSSGGTRQQLSPLCPGLHP